MSLIHREAARDVVKKQLRALIIQGVLGPETALSPSALAERFGVSMTPLREALIELAAEGFVDSVPARGFFVRPMTLAEVEELCPIVGALETLALETSVVTPGRLALLNDIHRKLAVASSPLRRMELDEAWHRALIADCPNRTLIDLAETARCRLLRYGYVFLERPQACPQSLAEHGEVLALLEQGRTAEAAAAHRQHWRSGTEIYRQWFEASGDRRPASHDAAKAGEIEGAL